MGFCGDLQRSCAIRTNQDMVCWGYGGTTEITGPFTHFIPGTTDCAMTEAGLVVCQLTDENAALVPAGIRYMTHAPDGSSGLDQLGEVRCWDGVYHGPR